MAGRLAGHLVVGDAGRLDRAAHRRGHHGVEQAHPLLGCEVGRHGLPGGAGEPDGQIGRAAGPGLGRADGGLDGLEAPARR